MNDTTDNLPAVAVSRGLAPWVPALFEEHGIPLTDGDEFARYTIERFGDQSQDVLDRALMLVSENNADLDIIGALLESNFGMAEIQICYEAALSLEVHKFDTTELVKKLIRFRRRFTDVQQSDDLAELISDALHDHNQYGLEKPTTESDDRDDPTRYVPGFIDMVVGLGASINSDNFDQVRRRLSKE